MAAFDGMLMLRTLLAACPRLMHWELECFTRPTFSFVGVLSSSSSIPFCLSNIAHILTDILLLV